jgi:aminoglycoside/choline kinase family phosphotransferase
MRAPIPDQADPVAATLALIREQAGHMESARLAPGCRAQIEAEIHWAEAFAEVARVGGQPQRLVLTDTQPGNFLVGADGLARFVDLEKALYGAPSIDLAHATLGPSVGWDPACDVELAMADVARFYRRYLAAAEPSYEAALRPWLAPMRRLTWLRTITIFAKMKARHRAGTWSGAQLSPAFRDRVLAHIDRCHDPEAMTAARAEWLTQGGLDAFL